MTDTPKVLSYGNQVRFHIHLCINLTDDWPKQSAKFHTFFRTVNTIGKPGHGKPIDQLEEHYN